MSLRDKHHHEKIEITEGSERRLKVVRQDRKWVEDLNCYIEIGGDKHKVINLSAFGILIVAPEKALPKELECPFIVENVELGILKLRQARVQKSFDNTRDLIGFEIVGEPFDISRINAVEDARKIIESSTKYQEATRRIPDSFARKVYEIKDWLEELQGEVNSIAAANEHVERHNHLEFEQAFVQVMGDYFNKVMPIKNQNLGELIKDYNDTVIKNCYEFFREKLKALIYQAPFSNRVFHKPLGYAGDYEMMNIIYRSSPEGDTLFAKCLHDYWVKQPAAQAVRNRARYIKSKIIDFTANKKEEPSKFLSVACGPAKEWQELLEEGVLSSTNHIVDLLDQDENALKHVQRKIKEQVYKSKSTIQFNYVNKAIKNIIARGLDTKYDLIYSAGLFDYFSEPVAQIAAKKLFEALNPGGKLIIGNFNVENPNSIVMDLALDWHLIYRSKADLTRMFDHIGDDLEIESEDLAINLFVVISKK